MRRWVERWSRSWGIAAGLLLLVGCKEPSQPLEALPPWSILKGDPLSIPRPLAVEFERARRDSVTAHRKSASDASSLALVHAYFPELAPTALPSDGRLPALSDDGGRALGVRLHDPATLTLDTRGLRFHIRRTSAHRAEGQLRREGEALVADRGHLWFPAGRRIETEQGWRTERVDEAWVLEVAQGVHRAEYEIQLPASVSRVHHAGDYLEFLGADGRPVLRFHPSEVRDAAGRRRRGTMELSGATPSPAAARIYAVNGDRLKLATEVRLAALTAPLVIDPGWSSTASLATARAQHAMVTVGTGEVFVYGGVNFSGYLTSTELYDPNSGTWSAGPPGTPTGNVTVGAGLLTGEVLVFTDSGQASVYNPVARTWSSTGPMTRTRGLPTANLLRSGKVLIAGGSNHDTAELFDPTTRTFTLTGTMNVIRRAAASSLLPDGRVLVSGGFNNAGGEVDSAELYDPTTGSWTLAAAPGQGRHYLNSTLLRTGQVLVTGGFGAGTLAQLYDPAANSWSSAGPMTESRNGHTQLLLPDGRVLLAGGAGAGSGGTGTTEVFSPDTNTFAPAEEVPPARENPTSTLLPSGRMLLAGGLSTSPGLAFHSDADLYVPATSSSVLSGTMTAQRRSAAATLLADGRVLIIGGAVYASADLYDPATGAVAAAADPGEARRDHLAVLLQDGSVLVTGGVSAGWLASAERYDPVADAWTPTGSMSVARSNFTATLLPSGKVLVAGGIAGASPLSSAELYDPSTGTWSPVGALGQARRNHLAVLLPSGKVLVAGGHDGGTVLVSAELFDPVTGTWSPAAALGTARSHASGTLLGSGRVLVAGGGGPATPAPAEVYDPSTNTWGAAGTLAKPRVGHSAVLLPSGLVMVAGGLLASDGAITASVELYDPALNTWSAGTNLQAARLHHSAVLLPRGRVLLLGGMGATGGLLASTELYETTGALEAWRPVVSNPARLYAGCAAQLSGLGFIGGSEGSTGTALGSPSNLPLVRLMANEGSGLWTLPADQISSTGLRVTPPATVAPGVYTLSVLTSGIPGGRVVELREDLPPTALGASLTTEHATPLAITLGGEDPDQTPSFTVLGLPSQGTLSGTPPEVSYTPAPGFVGSDAFTFQVEACGVTSAPATVSVEVRDTVAPALACPASLSLEATGPEGAAVAYPSISVTDAVSVSPTVAFDPAEGSTLPLGTHPVTVTASDDSGNEATCIFQVTVQDTTPPSLSCPSEVTAVATSAEGARVSFAAPSAEDAVTSAPEVETTPGDGSVFPHGTTTVTATARDAAGNQGSCSFNVTVTPGVSRLRGGGCSSGPGGPEGLSLLLGAGLFLARRRGTGGAAARSPALTSSRSRRASPHVRVALGVLVLGAVARAAPASAAELSPSFDLEQLRLSPSATDSLLAETGRVAESGSLRLSLAFGYERGSLFYELSDGSRHWLVRDRVQGWLTAAWSPLERLELSAQLPVTAWQGAGPTAALLTVDSAGLGTPVLGGRYALLRREGGAPLSLSAGLDLGLPGGSAGALNRQASWAGFQLVPRVSVGREAGMFMVGANLGLRLQGEVEVPGQRVGSALEAQVTASAPFRALRAELALQASQSLAHPTTAVELLAGVRVPLPSGMEGYVVLGRGFTGAPGSPAWRALLGLAWSRAAQPAGACVSGAPGCPAPVALAVADRCAPLAGGGLPPGCAPVDADSDSDGVPDALDNCPSEPGPASNQGCSAAKRQLVKIEADRLTPTREVSFADQRVLFPLGEASIVGEWATFLLQIADLLRTHPEIAHLRIEGHTDNSGPEELNLRLSQARADAVRAFLIENGVEPGRLTSSGLGPARPVASNDDARGRQANRRVEFIILKAEAP